MIDDDELAVLRQQHDAVLEDLAHAYPSIRALLDAGCVVDPINDRDGSHEHACRLVAAEVFRRHERHLAVLAARRRVDLAAAVAEKVRSPVEAAAAASSFRSTTAGALVERAAAGDDEAVDPVRREDELRDAVVLVLAARSLQASALEW